MPRGRRKDSTIPLSRALIIQRAYRDRKAKHLSELEDRCRKAEEENERLRVELQLARSDAAVASVHSDLARVCSDLMENLEKTQKALLLLQHRALASTSRTPQYPHEMQRTEPSATELDIATVLTQTLRHDSFAPTSQAQQPGDKRQSVEPLLEMTTNEDDNPECCLGIINCEGLIE